MVAARGRGDADTATRILDVAERLAQVRGFNGFSYADIAAQLGITKAALHYHFASKADLGQALISRYAARFSEALAAIDAGTSSAPAKLRGSNLWLLARYLPSCKEPAGHHIAAATAA